MATKMDIVKLALAELTSKAPTSISKPIARDERTAESLVDLVWEETLRRSTAWRSARRRIQLPADAAAGASPAFGYKYRYRLPSKFVRLVRIFDPAGHVEREGGYLLSDDSGPLNLVYIHLIDVSEADALLVSAAAARLAWRMAKRTTGSASLRAELARDFEERVAEAIRVAGSEGIARGRQASAELEFAGIDQTRYPLTAVERSRP